MIITGNFQNVMIFVSKGIHSWPSLFVDYTLACTGSSDYMKQRHVMAII